MKAIRNLGRTVAAIFRAIGKVIDKRLITPITKFVLLISEKTGTKTNRFEKWLTRKNTLIFLSLILAIGLFFLVDSKTIVLVDSSAEVLYDQKVKATYNREAYVIEGLPDKVDVTMIGRTVDLYLAKQLSTGSVSVDLTNYKEGTHKVNLNYESSIDSVNYKLDPSTVTVIIYPKISRQISVDVDLINKDHLESKLSIQEVNLDQKEIIIKGAEHVLEKVSKVKALVDIDNIIDPKAGVVTLNDVKLVAYDKEGQVVNVEMVPNKVTATISIISPSKELPIKIIPKGTVEFGKAISSLSSDISKISVYGEESAIEQLQFIPIEIDVTGLKENKTYNVNINKPQGIRDISVDKAVVTVTLASEIAKEIPDIRIETINLDSNYKAVAIGESSSKTSIIVKGTKDVIDNIDSSTIKATVDLKGYGEGDHEVEVKVEGEELKASYTPKTTKIKVRITRK